MQRRSLQLHGRVLAYQGVDAAEAAALHARLIVGDLGREAAVKLCCTLPPNTGPLNKEPQLMPMMES